MPLRYNEGDGLYVGTALAVTGLAMLRRIRQLTATYQSTGAEAAEAAEVAWSEALEEASWHLDADGVLPLPMPPPSPPRPAQS